MVVGDATRILKGLLVDGERIRAFVGGHGIVKIRIDHDGGLAECTGDFLLGDEDIHVVDDRVSRRLVRGRWGHDEREKASKRIAEGKDRLNKDCTEKE